MEEKSSETRGDGFLYKYGEMSEERSPQLDILEIFEGVSDYLIIKLKAAINRGYR